MKKLGAAQAKAVEGVKAFHDFTFTDRRGESGITFQHHVVADAARTYKAAHYDHGNGLAIADVDGDGLTDIYFANQVGGNQLWRNTGGGRFQDITASAGVAVPDRVSVTASFADIDNDGDADLYVTTVRGGNLLFENDGKGRFRDITAAAGLTYVGHSSGAVFFDYDRDGRLDLFLVNVGRYTTNTVAGEGYKYYVAFEDAFSGHLKPERAERSILYHNEGGNRFADVSKRAGIVDLSFTGDATALDGNDDGWLDLYLTNMEGDDQYYENAGGKGFVRKSRQVFPRTSWGSMGIKVFDFNNDGRLDIFVTDMHSDMSQTIPPEQEKLKSTMKWPVSFRGTGKTSIWGNSFFLKEGPNTFREVSDDIGAENYCPWGPSVGDLNADGFDDAFIASGMNYPERYMINSVKLNDGGRRFVDAEFVLGIEPRSGGVSTPFFELDASGKDRNHKDAQGESGRIAIWGARGTRAAAIFDVDGDGDLDIVTNDFNAAPMVLVSNLTDRTAGALRRGEADRVVLEPEWPGGGGEGHGERRHLHQGVRRKLRLPVAQPLPAVLRSRRGADGGWDRGAVAHGEETDGDGAFQDEFHDRCAGAVGINSQLPTPSSQGESFEQQGERRIDGLVGGLSPYRSRGSRWELGVGSWELTCFGL